MTSEVIEGQILPPFLRHSSSAASCAISIVVRFQLVPAVVYVTVYILGNIFIRRPFYSQYLLFFNTFLRM